VKQGDYEVAPKPSSLAICGSGNGAHALAVVASRNFDGAIDWLVGSEAKAGLLRRSVTASELHSTGVVEAPARSLRTISADPAEIIPYADIVLIVVPAFAHASVLDRIRPHVSEDTLIGCMPTRGGFEFEASKLEYRKSGKRPQIFGLQTLPWSTRVKDFGKVVHIGALKAEVILAALPATHAPRIAAHLTEILGTRVVATQSFLALTLGNPGQFIHSGLMYGHFSTWGGEEYEEGSIPMLYAGATEEMGDTVARLSDEAMAVAGEVEAQSDGALMLESVVLPIHDWLQTAYGQVTGDTSTVGSCFRTGPIQARKAPMTEIRPGRFVPDFGYRYLTEDVPFGLVATKAVAEIAGVTTPTIDDVIGWAQSVLEKTYLVDGRLEGANTTELPIPQNHGISTVSELVDWYTESETSGSTSRLAATRVP
jgi:predicted dinucleotide-binding enzyme